VLTYHGVILSSFVSNIISYAGNELGGGVGVCGGLSDPEKHK
jgi:hypothetical protein